MDKLVPYLYTPSLLSNLMFFVRTGNVIVGASPFAILLYISRATSWRFPPLLPWFSLSRTHISTSTIPGHDISWVTDSFTGSASISAVSVSSSFVSSTGSISSAASSIPASSSQSISARISSSSFVAPMMSPAPRKKISRSTNLLLQSLDCKCQRGRLSWAQCPISNPKPLLLDVHPVHFQKTRPFSLRPS